MAESEAKNWWEETKDTEYLAYILQPICDYPVNISRKVDEMGVLLTIDCDLRDMGKIIGRKGATAKCVRYLLGIFGVIHNARINLKFNEPEGSTHVGKETRTNGTRD